MSYTDFENVESGQAPGTIKGLLPIEDAWEALAYCKAITVQVYLDTDLGALGIEVKDPKGTWQVRIREDATRGPDGGYTGFILFEQTIEWTARVISLALGGGLNLVTWQPLGDAGAGKQQTTICDSSPCAVVTDVNDAAQMEAYGATGAWRFLDTVSFLPNATPRHKYDVEKGFSIFTSEGAATIGSYNFFATWQSSYYRFDIPAGAILETVYDTWQSGILTEALYTVSGREGAQGAASLFDERTGARWHLFVAKGIDKSRVQVVRSRQTRGVRSSLEVQFGTGITLGETDNGVVEDDSRLRGLQLTRASGGALVAMGATGGATSMLRVFVSSDEGEDWDRVMNQHLGITPLATCPAQDNAHIMIYGTNEQKKPFYARLEFGKVTLENGQTDNGWRATESGLVTGPPGIALPTKGTVELTQGSGGALRLQWRDATTGSLYILVSTDGGKTYARETIS